MLKVHETKKLFIDPEKDRTVGYGKYSTKQLSWVARNHKDYFLDIKILYYPKYNFTKQKEYDRLFKKYGAKIDRPQSFIAERRFAVNQFIFNKKNNIKLEVGKKAVKERFPDITDARIQDYYSEANATLKREFEMERELLIDLHMLRYEELFEKAMNPDLEGVHPKYHSMIIAEGYSTAIDLLSQKEKLLGIHTKNFKIQVNNYLQKKKQKKIEGINVEKISFANKIKLLAFIRKCKIAEDIIAPVTPAQQTQEHPVNKDQVLIEAPIQKAHNTDKLKAKQDALSDKNDLVPRSSGESLEGVKQKMKDIVQKQLENALKKNKRK